jgi:TolB-like protein/Tfp pilus assembly protein PilF
VLPFADMSPDKDQEYFCDGLAEEIINALTCIQDLRIIARTSAFSFKGKNMDVREIGRKLDVDYLLEGSLRKAGDNIRITTQLIDLSDGSHIWSEQYNRFLDDIFSIQEEISVKILEKMKVSLDKKERNLVTKKYTENIEAYNLYLQGKSYWHQFSEYGYKKGIEYFENALEQDPGFALAHASVAGCYVFLGWYYFMEPADAFTRAREAAVAALTMDEDLAEAHSVLALVSMVYDRNWIKAEEEFQRALELNPGSSEAHIFYSFFLAARDRHHESIEEGKKGLSLDPVTLFPGLNLGVRYYYARQYKNAHAVMQAAMDLNPQVAIAHLYTALPLIMLNRCDEAYIGTNAAIEEIGRDHPELRAMLGITEVFRGNRDIALTILDELYGLAKLKRVSCVFMAILCTVLEKFDEAIGWLERGLEQHDHLLIFLLVEPLLDKIQQDERFRDIVQKVGLDQK